VGDGVRLIVVVGLLIADMELEGIVVTCTSLVCATATLAIYFNFA
jgi:hypothetical protein